MADFDWQTRVYSITDKENEIVYVGEAQINPPNGYKPSGAGAYYSKREDIFFLSENMVTKTGAAIKSDSKGTFLGIFENGYANGPVILTDKNSPLRFTPFCKEGVASLYALVQMDDHEEYFISQLDENSNFTGKTIHYKKGRFYLENRTEFCNPTTPIREIICDWDYKPFYYNFKPNPISLNKAIRPLNVTSVSLKGTPYYSFDGGAQINSKKLKTYTYDDDTNIEYFKEDANGYGVTPIGNNALYVGEFKNNKTNGLGCISYGNGNKYIGFVSEDTPHGLGVLVTDQETVFSNFRTGYRYGLTFEFANDVLYIKVYHDLLGREPKHDYFEVDLKTFNIKKYSTTGSLLEDIPFEESETPVKELTPEDKMSPRLKKILEDYEYEFDSNEDLIITKCHLKKKVIMVPSPVVYVRPHTFENLPVEKIIFSDSVTHVNNEAIYNCKNLKEIEFSKSMTSINTDITNKLTTKAIAIPKNIEFISSAFRYCKINKAFIKNPECKFLPDSFPPGCKIYLDGKLLTQKEKQELTRRPVSGRTILNTKSKPKSSAPKKVTTKKDTSLIKQIKRKYSFWGKVKDFFKELPSTIAGIFAIPFKIGIPKLDWLALFITLIGVTSVVLGLTGVLDKIIWTAEFNPSFGYNFNMSGGVFEFMTETVDDFSKFILYGILLFIATVILWIIDLLLIIVLFIVSLIWLLIQFIGQVTLLYLIPIIVPILLFFRLKGTNENNTKFVTGCLVVSILALVSYFIAIIIIKNTGADPLVQFIIGFNKLK